SAKLNKFKQYAFKKQQKTLTLELFQEYLETLTEKPKNFEELEYYVKNWNVLNYAMDPLSKLDRVLNFNSRADVWVAYVFNKKPTHKFAIKDSGFVEMTMSVTTDQTAPFVLHMGISRGIKHIIDKRKAHSKIAARLHGFAANVMRIIDDKKLYMITTPMPMMLKLLSSALPESAVFIGSNDEKSPITVIGSSPYENNFEFILKNQ